MVLPKGTWPSVILLIF
jgi:hypothetical protein